MKFSAATLFAATASAAAVAKDSVLFSVTDFSAECIPHSTQCSYSFSVLQPNSMETTPVQCKAMLAGNLDGTLPDVREGACTESSRTFDIIRSVGGLTFTVSQPVSPKSNTTGTHLIPDDELVMSNEPNAVVQSYTGPSSFDLTFVQ
ncbi:hypersensitive response-inducing protein [Hypoxylon sp. FL1284]|nr:hypersensitive response-inducing protein [Hypoxylon sp. FL1284]